MGEGAKAGASEGVGQVQEGADRNGSTNGTQRRALTTLRAVQLGDRLCARVVDPRAKDLLDGLNEASQRWARGYGSIPQPHLRYDYIDDWTEDLDELVCEPVDPDWCDALSRRFLRDGHGFQPGLPDLSDLERVALCFDVEQAQTPKVASSGHHLVPVELSSTKGSLQMR